MGKQRIIVSTIDMAEVHKIIIWTLVLFIIYLFSSPAFAQSVVGSVLCSAYGLITFDIGRGLATLAVVTLGIGAMLGRVTWGQAVTVGAGIATTLSGLFILFALTPVSAVGAVSSGICLGQATAAAGQSALAAPIWSAIGLR